MSEDASERELINRARTRDDRAFEQLITLHRKHAWAVCVRITNNTADAEDALQDAMTAAWQHIDKYRGEAKFSTWLHRIAANAALSIVRRRRDIAVAEIEPDDPGHDAYREFDDRDRLQIALQRVPADFRTALVLREYGGLSYEEIAAHEGIGVQTVKSRIHRARSALATALLTD